MAMTPNERELAGLLQFDQDICLAVKKHTSSTLERLVGIDEAREHVPAEGLSVAVKDGDEAEQLMDAIRPHLESKGYRAFWSAREEPNGMHKGYEVAILKTADPFAMIRLRRSDGGNYGISTEDIIDRLTAWQQIAAFDVVGASTDWVALVFSKLPEQICAFAEEIFDFCPDSVGQGVGLLRERDQPEKFAAARQLCPEVSARIANYDQTSLAAVRAMDPEFAARAMKLNGTSTDMGVRLLAHKLKTTQFLWLWWD
jgi:hypothetical protein